MTLAGKMCTIRSRNPCGCVLTSEVISLPPTRATPAPGFVRSEEHTSELQSQSNLVCRLLLEKKKNDEDIIKALYSHEVKRVRVNPDHRENVERTITVGDVIDPHTGPLIVPGCHACTRDHFHN